MNKQDLIKTYKYRIELHAHSMPASQCCNCPQERFLELYSEMGVDAVCITNHFYKNSYIFKDKSKKECIDCYLDDYEKLCVSAKPYGIKILLGCEIRFADNTNDYLIFGVDRDILEEAFDHIGGTLEEYRNSVSLPKSVFIQAHPFRDNMVTVDPRLLDGIETMNFHPSHNSRNSVTAAYAKAYNIKICTGGSDFHHDRPFNPAALLMLSKELPEDSFELAKIIKENDYIFQLGDNHIIIP
ncbi:MAG: PHP domain-containing protein [Clostridia bacterium]|nr:PHP domain-containing protein [Clostridia bacterium]